MRQSLFATSLLTALSLAYPTDNPQNSNATSLEWKPCDLEFPPSIKDSIAALGEPTFCATLPVPLDYTSPGDERSLNLQLIKVKANKEPFKGSVLMNPGGPGGSGVELVATSGAPIRDVLGGHHDVIGFDPRGTGRTLPFVCIPSNTTASKAKRAERNFKIPQLDAYSMLEKKLWHDGGVFTEDCASTPGNADIAPFLNTPFVARDMLKIIDAIGEDKLQYWGISYGTVLGQTFAGMFPDRIKRMVLDSNLRLDDYYAGHWISVMRETERSLLNFFTECVNIGPEICPIANFTGPATTAEDLHNEYAKIIQELIDEPVFMPDDYQPASWIQPGGYPVLQDLKTYTWTQLYRPSQFPILNAVLSVAFKRDWALWISAMTTPVPTNATEIPWSLSANAFHGIACSDGAFRADKPEDMYSLIQAQASAGPFADNFSPQVWACAQWKFEAKERYTGPFTAINTSYPILFVNGNHDPITPLSGAYEIAANFPGSKILVQNGQGHGILNHPSKCTYTAIAKYFNDGDLPPVGTVCETDLTYYGAYKAWLAAQLGDSTTNNTAEKRSFVFEI